MYQQESVTSTVQSSLKITQADSVDSAQLVRELFREYLEWGNTKPQQEFGIQFDIVSIIESDMQTLDKFMPPRGRLLLGYVEERPSGIACLKSLTADIGEVKRMYVRPAVRRCGLGRALLNHLLEKGRRIGYKSVRLDSARFMVEAHGLYRACGFYEIGAYVGSEIPTEFQEHWIFMELDLSEQSLRRADQGLTDRCFETGICVNRMQKFPDN
jgi:GNAT superfamily N-acetyltransferase